MANNSDRNKIVESKKSKRIRIVMAVLYFIEVVLTTFSFTWIADENGNIKEFTAFELAVRPAGYETTEQIKLAILFAIFIIFPLICFFFCVLDKSNKKNVLSIICCLTCSCLITFGIGATIAMGAVVALLLYVLILFFTTQNLLLSVAPNKEE